MATGPAPSGGERTTASAVYRLGDALTRFRYYAELNYAAARKVEQPGGDPPVPAVIDTPLGELIEYALRVGDALPVLSGDVQAVIDAVKSIRNHIENVWRNDDHRFRLRQRQSNEEEIVDRGPSYFEWRVVSGSALAPAVWSEYTAAADGVQEHLPGVYSPIFGLSRLLARVSHPLPSDYDEALGTNPAFDGHRLLTDIGPQVVGLVRAVNESSGLLEGVGEWLSGVNPSASTGPWAERWPGTTARPQA